MLGGFIGKAPTFHPSNEVKYHGVDVRKGDVLIKNNGSLPLLISNVEIHMARPDWSLIRKIDDKKEGNDWLSISNQKNVVGIQKELFPEEEERIQYRIEGQYRQADEDQRVCYRVLRFYHNGKNGPYTDIRIQAELGKRITPKSAFLCIDFGTSNSSVTLKDSMIQTPQPISLFKGDAVCPTKSWMEEYPPYNKKEELPFFMVKKP